MVISGVPSDLAIAFQTACNNAADKTKNIKKGVTLTLVLSIKLLTDNNSVELVVFFVLLKIVG